MGSIPVIKVLKISPKIAAGYFWVKSVNWVKIENNEFDLINQNEAHDRISRMHILIAPPQIMKRSK